MIPHFYQEDAEVLYSGQIARNVYLMRLRAPEIARTCRPAQFVQVRTDVGGSPYLRRPFSALRADPEAGWIEVVYDAVGAGTRRMADAGPGHRLNLLGPLGRPFVPPAAGRLLMVAGGVGLVPLAFMAWFHSERRDAMVFLMGAASKERMPEMDRVIPSDLCRRLATDDGSLGHKGPVTDLIPDHVLQDDTQVLTCGPHAMMARVAGIAAERRLPCMASLENHMACGFGACVGCVVAYREAEREDHRYRRVCIEGPVVDAHAIVW
ncbi:MAG: dihydroorotate dehydrogenase electron transfer subunit [Gemmatimonadota bacterium]|nr:dihydroorotate dehydrogenase electron transfer subunit [Gemmatimonadota bacterium]